MIRRRSLSFAGLLCIAAGLALAPVGARAQGDDRPRVLLATVDGIITPVMADHVQDAVQRADEGGYSALVIRLDTPGGLDSSMRDITQALLNADVPTVVWVGPAGARAASAGAIITLASHVAAMAPGTTIGAATPVDLQGGDVEKKIVNDATAYAESLAEARGRDVEFARNAVLEAEAITEVEALERGVIEAVADDVRDLLEQIDGRTVSLTRGREATLDTAGANVDDYDLGLLRSIQQWLADPNIAFLFISIGTLAIIYEVANPGVGAGGILGAILLILAFFSFSVLPVNVVGVLLLVLAIALFIAELFVPGVGVLAAGGAVSLALSGVFLFRGSFGVDLWVLAPTVLVVGGGALLIARFAWRTRSAPQSAGGEALIGREVEVRAVSAQGAQVFVEGAWWRARRTDGEALSVGDRVRIDSLDGLELAVEPAAGSVATERDGRDAAPGTDE